MQQAKGSCSKIGKPADDAYANYGIINSNILIENL
jgi:hypothetical protein